MKVDNPTRFRNLVNFLSVLTLVSCAPQPSPDLTYAGIWDVIDNPLFSQAQSQRYLTLERDGTGKMYEIKVRWSVLNSESLVIVAPADSRTRIIAATGTGRIEGGIWKREFKIVGPSKLETYDNRGRLHLKLEKRAE